jgi:hypothetical protein
MITAAREYGADALAEQCLMIADDGRDVPRDTLKITTRRWLASKIAPRCYGERLAAEVSGAGGGPIEARAAPAPMVPAEVVKEPSRFQCGRHPLARRRSLPTIRPANWRLSARPARFLAA